MKQFLVIFLMMAGLAWYGYEWTLGSGRYVIYAPDTPPGEQNLFYGTDALEKIWPLILLACGPVSLLAAIRFIIYATGYHGRRAQEAIDKSRRESKNAINAYASDRAEMVQEFKRKTEVIKQEYDQKENRWRQAFKNVREEARQELEEQTEALNQRASSLLIQEQALKAQMAEVRKYVAGERNNTALARLEAEEAEERRRNASATAERRRRKLEKLQATGGTAGQKH
ncbi:TPA: hypothetical protein N2O62_005982 [Klebsiella michiganensis]|nr:hypothetical protein [Klebsiella michiganensis]HED2748710.1 hypothetical protein [Klebsiella michiganensis]HED3994058.1 hypothetical protein [Klebsiella michiganensis]